MKRHIVELLNVAVARQEYSCSISFVRQHQGLTSDSAHSTSYQARRCTKRSNLDFAKKRMPICRIYDLTLEAYFKVQLKS